MFDCAPSASSPTVSCPEDWTTELYLDAVHPRGGRGSVSGLTGSGDHLKSHTWSRDLVGAASATLVEQEAYIAMNPYFGPRGGDRRLAALNAVWLDLDTYRIPALSTLPRPEVQTHILRTVHAAGLPAPSLLVDSGRGFHCVWLIRGTSPAALPRWRALMKALARWARPLGADPACVDPARVLRLPGSWHEGAGRQVAIVAGDGARHAFEPFADAIWRAVGRPARRAYDAARGNRFRRDSGAQSDRRPRGLPRRSFWAAIRRDLDVLLDHWGGVVPVGLRDLWLHVHCCALTWIDPQADILDRILTRAAVVAPGLTSRELGRTMGSTIRRGLAARAGQPRACDPRYDYGSDRLCELFGIDAELATRLPLQQLIPAALRADRNRQRRTDRRRAAGALPRAIWLAANPISRLKPWEAQGISRATWYRRRAEAQRRRLADCVADLMAGSAEISVPCETGPAPHYKGEAPPAATKGPSLTHKARQNAPTVSHSRKSTEKTTGGGEPRHVKSEGARAFASAGADQSPGSTEREIPMADQPALDYDILRAGSQRLSLGELGALTQMAIVLARGSAHRLDLGRRAKVPPDMVDRLDAWLEVSADTGLVTGLVVPGDSRRPARVPRQGQLFDDSTVAPAPVSGRHSNSLRASTIEAGIRVLGRTGIGETLARSFLSGIIKESGFGPLAEAIDALEPRLADVAEPRSWIKAHIGKRKGGTAREGPGTIGRPPAAQSEATRPLATPEFLGISPRRAAQIQERNRSIAEWTASSSNTRKSVR
jgi:hypothetical protein